MCERVRVHVIHLQPTFIHDPCCLPTRSPCSSNMHFLPLAAWITTPSPRLAVRRWVPHWTKTARCLGLSTSIALRLPHERLCPVVDLCDQSPLF